MSSQEAVHVSLSVGNTDSRQRDSGHLAVSTSVWVAGLIKPAQSPHAGLETRLRANRERKGRTRTSVLTSPPWEGPRKKAGVSNRTWEIWPSGIIGGLRETPPWWECAPVLHIERAGTVTPRLTWARPISIPMGLGAQQVLANKGGRGDMIKAPSKLQDLRRRLYVKAQAEPTWRLEGCMSMVGIVVPGD